MRSKLDTEDYMLGTPLVVQWLSLHASTAWGAGLIPGKRTSTFPRASAKKKKEYTVNPAFSLRGESTFRKRRSWHPVPPLHGN